MSIVARLEDLLIAYEQRHGALPDVVVITQPQYDRLCAELQPAGLSGPYTHIRGVRIRIAPPTDQGVPHAG